MDWINLTQESYHWRALVSTIMTLRFENIVASS
jgi:hypothetical protein